MAKLKFLVKNQNHFFCYLSLKSAKIWRGSYRVFKLKFQKMSRIITEQNLVVQGPFYR